MIVATVTGNLGKDAEMRDAGQSSVLSFSVASNATVKGEKVTTWVRCSMWGSRGEKLAHYLKQGTKVAVSGPLTSREYNGKTYFEMQRVNELDFMGGGNRSESTALPTEPNHSAPAEGGLDDDPSDIPF